MSDRIDIRPATLADAQQIAKLCHQLSYACSEAAVEQRLKHIQQDRNHAVFVAESLDGAIAWIHAFIRLQEKAIAPLVALSICTFGTQINDARSIIRLD